MKNDTHTHTHSNNRTKLVTLFAAFILLLCSVFLWGIQTIHSQIFPYDFLRKIYYHSGLRAQHTSDLTTIKIDIESIRKSFYQAELKRKFLMNRLVAPINVTSIKKEDNRNTEIIITTIHGVSIKSILTKAITNNQKCLRIYIQGHGGNPFNFTFHNDLLNDFISNGCDVLSMSMIGLGLNEGKSSFPTHFGSITLSMMEAGNHGNYAFFYDPNNIRLDPLALFISPHYHTIKSILGNYQESALIGLSGGGWYVSFLSAIIPEIDISINYAGTLPLEYRKFAKNHGDWEQVYSYIYRDISYWDLYKLSTLDANFEASRKSYLIYNSKDSCCFSNPYASHFKKVIDDLLINNLEVYIDDSPFHSINPPLVSSILTKHTSPN